MNGDRVLVDVQTEAAALIAKGCSPEAAYRIAADIVRARRLIETARRLMADYTRSQQGFSSPLN